MENTVALVPIADELARKKFGVENKEVWNLETYSLSKNALSLNYSNHTGILVTIKIATDLLKGMEQ